jgi:hypothetical protein
LSAAISLSFLKSEHDKCIYSEDIVARTIPELQAIQGHTIFESEWGTAVDRVYPSFSAADQEEFDHALNHDAISRHQDRFEAGLQQEWGLTDNVS